MHSHTTRMLLTVIALAAAFTTSNTASAAPDPLKRAVCCKIGDSHRLMPFASDCRKQNGKVVGKSKCRSSSRARANTSTRSGSGRPPARSASPQPRSSTSTHGGSGKPPARSSGPQPRSSTSTHGGSGKPPARDHRGYPQSKPNGSLAGCKPRLSVTRYYAFTKDGALLTAWITWEEASTNKYGSEYVAKNSRERNVGCSKNGTMWTCTVSALPCPPL